MSTINIWHSSVGEICLFYHTFIFIYCIHYLYQFGFILYFRLWFNMLFIWLLQLFQLCPLKILSGWLLCPIEMLPVFYILSTFLLSGIKRSSRLILYISFSSPRINHFPKDFWFLFLENGISNQDLGTGWAFFSITISDYLQHRRSLLIFIYWSYNYQYEI